MPNSMTLNEFQLTAARRRLAIAPSSAIRSSRFQLTAARRRLAGPDEIRRLKDLVSTHSRPEAAGGNTDGQPSSASCFNSQPPGGGWLLRAY